MAQVEIKGDDILLRALQTAANMKAHKAAVQKHGADLQKKAQSNAVFTHGYATGATKRSIKLVTAGTDYSGYLEKGTRFMDAQPFMKPAFDVVQPKFINDLRRAGIAK